MNENLIPLTALFIGMGMSFGGTLPPGVISITVMDTAARKSLRDGLIVAATAAFVEFFQALIAMFFSKVITESEFLTTVLHYGAIPIFFIVGVYTFIRKPKPEAPQKTSSAATNIAKGIFIATTNLLVIPFWIAWSAYFVSSGWMNYQLLTVVCFSLGVTTGTFLALMLYAKVGLAITSKTRLMDIWGRKILGMIFILFAGYQLVRVLLSDAP